MFRFDHERIPERVAHARGYGAHGYFEKLRAAHRADPGRHLLRGRVSAMTSSELAGQRPAEATKAKTWSKSGPRPAGDFPAPAFRRHAAAQARPS
ncbi:MAG TPA: catalase [Streptosporangiaceae bacterium]